MSAPLDEVDEPDAAADLLLDRTVAPGEDGARADQVLSAWLDEPRARTQERIAEGQVRLLGAPVAKSRRLRSGERLTVAPPPPIAPHAPPPPVPVRWEDAHLAVVAKPAGLVVHAGSGVTDGTLVDALLATGMTLAAGDDADRPGIVHRLDRGTSGLLVVAKSVEARIGLAAVFRAHEAHREYTAVVDGVPDPPSATIDAPIARDANQRTRFAVSPTGRPAVTLYDVVEAAGRAALLDVRLRTGRTHQVRVHLAAVGHPVSGDTAYGASAALAAALGLARPALHARQLGFTHPVTGERVDVTEPPPEDLALAVERLRAVGP